MSSYVQLDLFRVPIVECAACPSGQPMKSDDPSFGLLILALIIEAFPFIVTTSFIRNQ